MKRWLATTALVVAGCGGSSAPAPAPTPTPTATAARVAPLCRQSATTELARARSPAVTELSGLARTRQGTFWTHNDSGDSPRVFELDADGTYVREVAVGNAEAIDWEDVAIRGATLYVGDIGDNLGRRRDIAVYRFRVPAGATVAATRIRLRYPDRPHDAEALLVDPRTGALVIVSKDLGGVAEVFTARRAGPLRKAATLELGIGQAVTAGDISADGATIALRSYDRAFIWERAKDESLTEALAKPPCAVDADLLGEGQGETLALSRDGRAFYTIPEGANPLLRRYGG